jgi:hypothetical protein
MKILWLIVMPLLCGVISFGVTRGPDGDLSGCLLYFTIAGLFDWVFLGRSKHQPTVLYRVALLILCLVAAFVGWSIAPHLDEMAGLIYYLIIGLLLGIAGGGEVILLFRRAR